MFSDQLFVRPHYEHYYFGDYYDSRYQNTGFFASFSYQSSRYGYDPIYVHRRWEHRGDRDWERQDRTTFEHRRNFAEARPPRTLLAQRELSARGVRPGENRIEVAAPFEQLAKRKEGPVRFQKIDKTEREQLAQRGRAIQNTRGERQKLEISNATVPNRKAPPLSEPTKVKLPKPLIVAKPVDQLGKGQAPPKRHQVPNPDPKVEPKTKRADSKPVAKRETPASKVDRTTEASKAQPQSKKPDPKPQASKGESNGKSKDDKKQKDDAKGKP